jgi:hypothetical protein
LAFTIQYLFTTESSEESSLPQKNWCRREQHLTMSLIPSCSTLHDVLLLMSQLRQQNPSPAHTIEAFHNTTTTTTTTITTQDLTTLGEIPGALTVSFVAELGVDTPVAVATTTALFTPC